MMDMCNRRSLQATVIVLVIVLLTFYVMQYHKPHEVPTEEAHTPKPRSQLLTGLPPPEPCACPPHSSLQEHIRKDQYEEVVKRRAKEFQQHKVRTASVLSKLLFALPNSPLQYPIQGFRVRPLTTTLIPGLALDAGERSNYTKRWDLSGEPERQEQQQQLCVSPSLPHLNKPKYLMRKEVSLSVSKGVLTIAIPSGGMNIQGNGESTLILWSSSLVILNVLLTEVSYTSTIYHIHTGDLVTFQFENHEAVFPITIKEHQVPVLYDMGTDISSQVTITTKTFLRYPQLKGLLSSIRKFYSNIEVIIADDSFEPEHLTGEHIQQYFMPGGQGWFAGRTLAVSQVTTKYFLWVDDDFVFTEGTKIEKLVEVMEAVPELDVVGGSVIGNQYYFTFRYDEGDETDGGCLDTKMGGKFHSIPGYPQCRLVSGVVNFFLARTDAVQKVGFDPKIKRMGHVEFFIDGLGLLMVATCNHVSVGHHQATSKIYNSFRYPPKSVKEFRLQNHFFKNYLKCVRTDL